MQVILIRHPPVIADALCYGQSAVPLAEGEPQTTAERIKPLLPSEPCQIYTSPLSRCIRLAEKLPMKAPVIEIPDLMELHFGDWENTPWDAIPKNDLERWTHHFVHQAPPAGESLQTLYTRVTGFLTSLRRQQTQTAIIITHAGPIRCIFASILHIPLNQIFKISIGYGCAYRITLGRTPDTDQISLNMPQNG